MNVDTVFRALAHPARRRILSLLADSSHSVRELTAEFRMSQSAVSQHLRELKDAKLVVSAKAGVERRYRLTGEPLQLVFEWSARYRRFFDTADQAWLPAGAVQKPTIRKIGRRRASSRIPVRHAS
jgi:DNA-binding transcriptional ArsR family regulator